MSKATADIRLHHNKSVQFQGVDNVKAAGAKMLR